MVACVDVSAEIEYVDLRGQRKRDMAYKIPKCSFSTKAISIDEICGNVDYFYFVQFGPDFPHTIL